MMMVMTAFMVMLMLVGMFMGICYIRGGVMTVVVVMIVMMVVRVFSKAGVHGAVVELDTEAGPKNRTLRRLFSTQAVTGNVELCQFSFDGFKIDPQIEQAPKNMSPLIPEMTSRYKVRISDPPYWSND